MIEKLQMYINELVAEKNTILSLDPSAEIETKVNEYRIKLIAEYKDATNAAIAKINNNIECISNIISRESEAKVPEDVKEGE